jgi:GT2 family glycosyltransferase
VVVVDQSLQPYDLSHWGKVTHLWNPQLSGLTAARNFALRVVATDLVLFLDDDCELLSDCVGALIRDFNARPDAIGLGCVIESHCRPSTLGQLRLVCLERGFFSRSPQRTRDGIKLRTLPGGGMAFRRSLFARELFDEQLSGYCDGEDFEFSRRAARHGNLWLCPAAVIAHHEASTNRLSVKRVRQAHWSNWLYFFRKHNPTPDFSDKLTLLLWCLSETILWMRNGLGLPPLRDLLSPPARDGKA